MTKKLRLENGAKDVQVELDIQREVWHATQAPRWFAAAERRRVAARAARAFAAQSRRSRAPRQPGQRADPPRAGAAVPTSFFIERVLTKE